MADPEPQDAEAEGWIVETASGSTYLLDPLAGSIQRLPGYGAGSLRRDREPIPLLRWTTPVVGLPLILLLRVREDRVTVRITTPVVRICRRTTPSSGTR